MGTLFERTGDAFRRETELNHAYPCVKRFVVPGQFSVAESKPAHAFEGDLSLFNAGELREVVEAIDTVGKIAGRTDIFEAPDKIAGMGVEVLIDHASDGIPTLKGSVEAVVVDAVLGEKGSKLASGTFTSGVGKLFDKRWDVERRYGFLLGSVGQTDSIPLSSVRGKFW